MYKLVVVVLIVSCNLSLSITAETEQYVTLFFHTNCQGTAFSFGGLPSSDLKKHNFDKMASSVALQGAWIFYNKPDFNRKDGKVEFVFRARDECVDLRNLKNNVTSLRYAGNPGDFQDNSLTLYSDTLFQNHQYTTKMNEPNLKTRFSKVSSFIITGSQPWTFYTLPLFQGEGVCIFPPSVFDNYNTIFFQPAFVFNVYNVDIHSNSVESVRIGCYGSKQYTAPVIGHGYN